MSTRTLDVNAMVQRLEKLERQARHFRRAAFCLLVLLVGLLAMGQSRPGGRTVEAESFILRDAQGKVRATLAMSDSGPVLSMSDAAGNARLFLSVASAVRNKRPVVAPRLGFTDASGRSVVLINGENVEGFGPTVRIDSPQGGITLDSHSPSLRFWDKNGKQVVTLETGPDAQTARLMLTPTSAGAVALLGTGNPGTDLFLSSDMGGNVAVGADPDGPNVRLTDHEGFKAQLGATSLSASSFSGRKHQTSAASLVLFSHDGKVLWTAP